eukprot:scaffold776_cov203-Alexandrium_tamarense.AAC.7
MVHDKRCALLSAWVSVIAEMAARAASSSPSPTHEDLRGSSVCHPSTRHIDSIHSNPPLKPTDGNCVNSPGAGRATRIFPNHSQLTVTAQLNSLHRVFASVASVLRQHEHIVDLPCHIS